MRRRRRQIFDEARALCFGDVRENCGHCADVVAVVVRADDNADLRAAAGGDRGAQVLQVAVETRPTGVQQQSPGN